MPPERNNCIFKKVGLGEGAKMAAASLLGSTTGYVSIPVLIGGTQRVFMLQWSTLSIPQSSDGSLVVVDASWPVPFPTACMSIMQALNNSLIYYTAGTPFSSSRIVDRSKFQAASSYSKSSSTVTVWGVGY